MANLLRLEKMKAYIDRQGTVTIRELVELFPEVSLMTIHRDLDVLEKEHFLVKFRGGARVIPQKTPSEFQLRMKKNTVGKQLIARKAVELLKPHSSIFLDSGTTGLEFAKIIPDMNLNIFTTSPGIALELCRLLNTNITMCCGRMNPKSLAVSGQNTLEMLDKINIDMAFVGTSGFTLDSGFTCGTETDMLVKRLVVLKARRSILLCTEEKIGSVLPYTFAGITEIDDLITDCTLSPGMQKAAAIAGIRLL